MKKEFILSELDKKIKKEKIEQNRRKRRGPSSGEDDELITKKPTKRMVIINENPVSCESPSSDEVSINSSPKEIVMALMNGRQRISCLMKTKKDAVEVMEKIINSPEDALTLISHFISNPADALVIIQKIMDSPLNALSVFNQFLQSSTNALSVQRNIKKYLTAINDTVFLGHKQDHELSK